MKTKSYDQKNVRRLRAVSDLLWLILYAAAGISVYYRHEKESWRLLWTDVNLLFRGIFDFLKHGKKIMLLWLIAGIAFALFLFLFRRLKEIYRAEIALAVLLLAASVVYIIMDYRTPQPDDSWKVNTRIAHSLGGIDGYKSTGSLEAFLKNYEAGARCFECDLLFTEDRQIVLAHDWELTKEMQEDIPDEGTPTEEEFLGDLIYDRYTPMNFEDLCILMKDHPDAYLVTDSKYTDPELVREEFGQMIDIVKELGAEEILDRFIIQVYNRDMYQIISEIYPFREYLLTLYKIWEGDVNDFIRYCRWCKTRGITTITMKYQLLTEEFLQIAARYGIDIYVHTVNDAEKEEEQLKRGVKGIYTDFLIGES